MSLLNRVKELAKHKNVSLAEIERNTGLSNGSITKWDKSSPKAESLQKVAAYFDVSTDYLLNLTNKRRYYDLTDNDDKDIAIELEDMIADLKSTGALAYSEETAEIDRKTHELLVASLENSLNIAKIDAGKYLPPKKSRD